MHGLFSCRHKLTRESPADSQINYLQFLLNYGVKLLQDSHKEKKAKKKDKKRVFYILSNIQFHYFKYA